MSLVLRCPDCGGRAESLRSLGDSGLYFCPSHDCTRVFVKAPARTASLKVVVEMEDNGFPQLLGTYEGTDEDTVCYADTSGIVRFAPVDCVRVVTVTL